MTYQTAAKVTNEITAISAKSGTLPVLATPFMIALMEQAASELCEREIESGKTTVGTAINIAHMAASVIGAEIKVTARVTDIDRRKICFEVEAFDNAGLIGKGTHERFIVDSDAFIKKANIRAAQQ